MCRLAAYLGQPVPLAALIYDSPHGLESQAYRPREMITGTVSVDGTGIAWWDGTDPEPLRYITERPPWSDPNLPALSRRLGGGVQLAAVRSATHRLEGSARWRDGRLIASEPLDDDPGWSEVPVDSILAVTPGGFETSPL